MPWLDAGGRLSYIPPTVKPLRILADNANGQPGAEQWAVDATGHTGGSQGAPNIDVGTTAQIDTTKYLNPDGAGGVQWTVPADVDTGIGVDGWVAVGHTLAYGTADAPTFTATCAGVDLTSVIGVGMRIKLTQTTVKYFIVTAIVFSTNTTITLYGGTDYTLANAAITLPFYSPVKAPLGFPLDQTKWPALSDLVDLGVVNAIDLLNGPQTLYTPSAGQVLQFQPSYAGFVAMGAVDFGVLFYDVTPDPDVQVIYQWNSQAVVAPNAAAFNGRLASGMPITIIGEANLQNDVFIVGPVSAWQANHAYAATTTLNGVLVSGAGHFWSCNFGGAAGVSGGSAPDFAGHIGGTVTDGGYSGAITAVSQGAKTFTVAGDYAAIIPPASSVVITGSTGNDGTYTVVSAVFGAGHTVITVVEAIPDATADGNLADSADVITWTDEGEIPTVGSLHLYLLVYPNAESAYL